MLMIACQSHACALGWGGFYSTQCGSITHLNWLVVMMVDQPFLEPNSMWFELKPGYGWTTIAAGEGVRQRLGQEQGPRLLSRPSQES